VIDAFQNELKDFHTSEHPRRSQETGIVKQILRSSGIDDKAYRNAFDEL